ncbi:MAG TPA: response regulator, partial [Candidatus Acidoferrum sp.]|nr:response regulator [Candidatus Acidoferrum sp.]
MHNTSLRNPEAATRHAGHGSEDPLPPRSLPLVLVGDDDPTQRLIARDCLEQAGFQVEEAADGTQVFSAFCRVRPDILLLDVNMPDQDGHLICARLRQTAEGATVPVVMLTASDDEASIHRAYEVGATDFIPKPVHWTLLCHRLRHILGASRAHALLRMAAEALRQSEDRFAMAFHASSDEIGICDLDGRYIDVNDSFLRCSGYAREEVLGRTCLELGRFADVADWEQILLALGKHAAVGEVKARFRTKLGEIREVLLSARLSQLQGKPCLLLIARDITERNQLVAQLHQAQKMEAVGRLAAGIAHDFISRLSLILGRTEQLLPRLPEASPVRADVEVIQAEAENAFRVTAQLLEFSRKTVPERRPLDLNTVINGLHDLIRQAVGERVECRLALAPDLGWVEADRSRIEQLLLNLVVNAREAMPEGGRLTIRTGNVRLEPAFLRGLAGARPGPHVMLAVEDTGRGMDEKLRTRVFEP